MLAERTSNAHLDKAVTEENFVAMRSQRDSTLGMPRLILSTTQVNMRRGYLPEPEENGGVYFKLPSTCCARNWPCCNLSPQSWRLPAAC